MRELDIGHVSQRSGLPVSTLRFYEEKGLIASVGRRGLRRQFDAGVLERLALIALARAAGFSLGEIAPMFTADGPRLDRKKLAAKAEELDRTIRELTVMRDSLRHAAACPARTHMECPIFRRSLRAAASGAMGARGKMRANVKPVLGGIKASVRSTIQGSKRSPNATVEAKRGSRGVL